MKRMLKTYVIQEGTRINATQLFKDLERVVEEDKKAGVEITRKHPAQKLINRFSGQYISPTMVKGFYNCPAGQVIGSVAPYDSRKVTSVGTTMHSILQEFYMAEGKNRTMKFLDEVTNRLCNENHEFDEQKNQVKLYIEGFKNTPHYNTGLPMDHENLNCFTELFIKETCSPLGVTIPVPIYSAIDRVDFNDDGVYAIDYKSGTYFSNSVFTYNGYLPQLMVYGWAIYAKYGEKVKNAYILTPGIKKKYHDIDIHNIKLQSMYIEQLFQYIQDAAKTSESRIYEEKQMPYCGGCNMKNVCNVYNRTSNMQDDKIDIEYDITLPEEEAPEGAADHLGS